MTPDRTFKRIFAIPDIHGRSDLLALAFEALAKIGYSPDDMLIFLGDLIDRGPDSKGVIDLVKAKVEANPASVFALRGNHEDFAIAVHGQGRDDIRGLWYQNGGYTTDLSYPSRFMSEEHVAFLASRPYVVEAQGFFFSHAPVPREKKRNGRSFTGVQHGQKNQPYTTDELNWSYFGAECEKSGGYMDVHEGPLSDNGTGSEHLTGICGHIKRGPQATTVRIFPKYRMLDTGCGCYETSPLVIHECLGSETIYVRTET